MVQVVVFLLFFCFFFFLFSLFSLFPFLFIGKCFFFFWDLYFHGFRGNLKENGVSWSATTRPNWRLSALLWVPMAHWGCKSLSWEHEGTLTQTELAIIMQIPLLGVSVLHAFGPQIASTATIQDINRFLFTCCFHLIFQYMHGSQNQSMGTFRFEITELLCCEWEGAMHQRSSNKNCQTIIESIYSDELTQPIVAQFHSTFVGDGPSAIVGDVYLACS